MILYLLVEGDSDRQFIEKVIAPCLPTPVQILAYAGWTAKHRENQIRSLLSGCEKGMLDYYALMDMDNRPCYTACREFLIGLFGGLLPPERIIVTNRSVEAWYLAGYTGSRYLKKMRLPALAEGIRAADFRNAAMSAGVDPTIVLDELLRRYDLSQARQRSPSLDYFCRKLEI
jgi:hypothetical protein